MNKIYNLYHLIDENNEVKYVGITTNVKPRINKHKRQKPPHTLVVVKQFNNPEDAGLEEQKDIRKYNTSNNGWNRSIGGELLLTGENHPAYTHGLSQTPEYKKQHDKIYYEKNKEKRKEQMRIANQTRRHPCLCLSTGMKY